MGYVDRAELGTQGQRVTSAQGHVSVGQGHVSVCLACVGMRIQNHGHVRAVDREGESCVVGHVLESKTRGGAAAARRPALARTCLACFLASSCSASFLSCSASFSFLLFPNKPIDLDDATQCYFDDPDKSEHLKPV